MKRKHIKKCRYEGKRHGVFPIAPGISQKIALWKSQNLFVNLVFIFKQESAVIENGALTQF